MEAGEPREEDSSRRELLVLGLLLWSEVEGASWLERMEFNGC